MTTGQISNITQSLQRYYMSENPPPANVVVYKDSIKPMEPMDDEPARDWYQAAVKITSNFVSVRQHKVHLMFKANRLGKVDVSTIDFLY